MLCKRIDVLYIIAANEIAIEHENAFYIIYDIDALKKTLIVYSSKNYRKQG